ncbi:glycosyltransferase family 2 protein [Sphingomonas sp.]|uniref:glycosyltransferase family 2 protein n=1 Tax=Sphingomonas sp. TaxID=28214 RepID=UPI0025CF2E3E|nr:glycosyltransferase family 2 protein [Sphingomonas sp.]
MPLVSVVIPTFGRPELVCRAVVGSLAQTLSDIEVIVVVDGVDPPTNAALALLKDDRLRVINHDGKRGAGQARDTGADAATGQWIAFLDDDDEWLPTKLAAQVAIAPPEPAVIMTLSKVVSSTGTFVRPAEIYDNVMPVDEWLFDRRTWLKGGQSFLQTSSLMFPAALFKLARFTDTKQHEEWELVIRAVKQHGYRLVTVPEPLVIYYVPEARKSLSRTYTWRQSIAWAVGMRSVLTPRAFSGFCLTVVAQMAASTGNREAFGPLFTNAARAGRPTLKQLFAFAFFFVSPETLRRRIRAGMQAER